MHMSCLLQTLQKQIVQENCWKAGIFWKSAFQPHFLPMSKNLASEQISFTNLSCHRLDVKDSVINMTQICITDNLFINFLVYCLTGRNNDYAE